MNKAVDCKVYFDLFLPRPEPRNCKKNVKQENVKKL